MRHLALVLFLLANVALPARAGDGPEKLLARRLAARAGVRKGLCLDLGCGDASLAIALARETSMFVQCVAADEAAAAKARLAVDAAGLYGTRISVNRGDLQHLAYPDRCADLVICGDEFVSGKAGRDFKELWRVLSPNGVALIGQSVTAAKTGRKLSRAELEGWLREAGIKTYNLIEEDGVWARITRARPAGSDQWSHRCRNAGNAFGSDDTAAVPPFKLQWAVDCPPSLASAGMLVAGGRQFILGLGYPDQPKTTPSIHAYDAYNGVPLWSRVGVKDLPIDRTWKHYSPEKSSSDAVVTADALYLLGAKLLHVFDPDTGKIVKSLPVPAIAKPGPGEVWRHLMHADGLLIGAVGSWGGYRRPGNHGMGRRGVVRALVGLEPKSLAPRWTAPAAAWTNSLAAGGGRIYFIDKAGKLHALDLKSGRKDWSSEEVAILAGHIPRLVSYHRGKIWVLQFRRGTKKERRSITAGMEVVVFSAENGKKLFQPNFNGKNPTFLSFAGDHVVGTPCHSMIPATLLKESTGEAKWVRKLGTGGCTPTIATPGYLFGRYRSGPGFLDLKQEKARPFAYAGLRPTCFYPPVPANGMVYIPAPGCNCGHAFRANLAMAHGTVPEPNSEGRLVKGPAFGAQTSEPKGSPVWRGWRADASRSGVTAGAAGIPLKKLWEAKLPARATPLAVTGGLVLVGAADHKLRALDAASGEAKWKHITEGSIRLAPWLAGGRVYAADDAGWVYCLRGTDGALAWRFRAAPAEDRVVVNGRFASRWRAGCGVIVEGGTAYCTAGFFPHDRTAICALDARTGAVKWEQLNKPASLAASGPLVLAGGKLFVPSQWGPPKAIALNDEKRRLGSAGGGSAMHCAKGGHLMAAAEGVIVRWLQLQYIHHVSNYRVFSSALPVLTKEMIYLRDGRNLTAEKRAAYKIAAGRISPVKPPKSRATSDPAALKWSAWKDRRMYAAILAGGTLFSGGDDQVYATGAADGKERWSAPVPGRVRDLAFCNGSLFVVCDPGIIICFKGAATAP